MATQRKSPMDHPAVVTFLILAIIAAMSLAAEVLKPLALAVLLSFALAPLAGFFERRRVPRAIAVLLTVALALGCLSGIGYVVVRQLSMLAYELPSYQKEIQKKVDFLKPSDNTALYRAQKVAGDVAKSLDTPVVARARGDGRAGRRAAHVPAAPPVGRRPLPGVHRASVVSCSSWSCSCS